VEISTYCSPLDVPLLNSSPHHTCLLLTILMLCMCYYIFIVTYLTLFHLKLYVLRNININILNFFFFK